MGEAVTDRAACCGCWRECAPHPESVPINALVPVAGTPLADRPRIDPLDLVAHGGDGAHRPAGYDRAPVGGPRAQLGREAQILCFLAGANSVFSGETLLTTPNAEHDDDAALLPPSNPGGPPEAPTARS